MIKQLEGKECVREISLEESKRLELDILLDVAEFCEKHQLKYFLTYGTLIGAFRHKGFIPWDDDVDIQMPRSDYNKMIELFNAEKGEAHRYKLITPYDKNAKHAIVKVIDTKTVKLEEGFTYKKGKYLGVDVDIFPIDGTPNCEEEYNKWYKKLQKIYRRHLYSKMAFNGSLIQRCKMLCHKLPGLFSSSNGWLNKARKLHEKYPYEASACVGSIACLYNGKGNRVAKEHYEGFVEVEFEGYSFKAPKGYHEILTSLYGDYMKLPPEDKRVTHHKNNVFWKEEK